MTSHDLRPDDREALSALFDGELDDEARRFAARRLAHDAAWQSACGRWQAIGDAMRRQAPIAAPAGFADAVSAAVAMERPAARPAAAAPVPAPARARRMRWIGGGALAASLALAAVMSLRTTDTATQGAPPVLADAATPAPPQSPPALAQTAAPTAAAIASVEAPGGIASTAVAARPVQSSPSPAVVARRARPAAGAAASRIDVAPAVAEAALQAGRSGNPFNLTGDEPLTARPWPRAALGTGATSFTARYGAAGDSAGQRPSFYPFEPRPQGEPDPAPAP